MPTTYKTPGVYVEEIASFPPSIAEVGTAIPAFIGFTEKGTKNFPVYIENWMEYQVTFGGPDLEKSISVTIENDQVASVSIDPAKKSKNIMYYAMNLFFNNGGGPCWVISTGNYDAAAAATVDDYTSALDVVRKEDEPTLIVFPDAPVILEAKAYYGLVNLALAQCEDLGDRFAIIDVVDVNNDLLASSAAFRAVVGTDLDHAKYGAAYYPYLNTIISYGYDTKSIAVSVAPDPARAAALKNAQDAAQTARETAKAAKADADNAATAAAANAADPKLSAAAKKASDKSADADRAIKTADDAVTAAALPKQDFTNLSNSAQNLIKQKVSELGVTLPPAAAIAGLYANVDNFKGVWKSPANVGLIFVDSPTVKITDREQENMNVDVDGGKSINAIRTFAGKGTLVWGARTLAGNDNEWRYISVRRFFNMVEESVKKSTAWAVFESNDANTWTKVRAMIENYLFLKWRDGALAGAKSEEAYYVRVGLGTTMTAQDILEGRMYVEIGMAVVRPAEFIILRFSHKLQTS